MCLMTYLVVLPVQAKYMWKIKNPKRGRASTPTTIEQITITAVEFTPFPALDMEKIITLMTNVSKVSIVLAKNNMKKR